MKKINHKRNRIGKQIKRMKRKKTWKGRKKWKALKKCDHKEWNCFPKLEADPILILLSEYIWLSDFGTKVFSFFSIGLTVTVMRGKDRFGLSGWEEQGLSKAGNVRWGFPFCKLKLLNFIFYLNNKSLIYYMLAAAGRNQIFLRQPYQSNIQNSKLQFAKLYR